ncbi:hypothetical protein BBAD15_g7812 [Beauveria bassiana D1-5]|uniref:Zn(2)-C6 fungal-type domain-containing protein n=1 Tax=Beauveria bassiana D1-5 TaxID=1245745 RepID=A0A0A2W1I7_BEABA|nr:hypothetical protein BBAD15_g7812 [Beauveria bassiana D1-5]
MPDPDIAQFTSVFRAGKPDRVQRNRQPVSCMACQRRKSRCDKRHPSQTRRPSSPTLPSRSCPSSYDASCCTRSPCGGRPTKRRCGSATGCGRGMTRSPAACASGSIRSTAFTDANYNHYAPHHARAHVPQVPLHAAPPLPDRAQGRPGLTTAPGRRAAPPPSPCSRCTSSSTTRLAPPAACTRTAPWVSYLTLQRYLLASTIVCVDLSESRDMPPAERRRCQALLTRSHDVWAARRAYSSDAHHATKILRAVLKRVDGGAPVCDDTGTVTRVSSSSAGVYPATGLKPPQPKS